jgi:glyoxylase-like metal-dependent hydrolase (beta-lactamase superfamily II)
MTDIKVHDVLGRFPVLPSHVHAYVVELPTAVVIVDGTAAISSGQQARDLADSLGKPVEAVLMTHGHPDHFTGLTAMKDLPRYATQGTIDFAHREDETKWESGKMYLGDDFPDERVFPESVVQDGDTKTFGGVGFTLVNLGPGESDDDNMWLADVDGTQYAFVGDAICNGTHAFFGDGHALHWLENLDRLASLLRPNAQIYVGHGDAPASVSAIAEQKAYIHKFIDTIQDLPRESPVSQATVEKVMGVMKEYQPTEMLFFLLGYELDQGIARVWQTLDAQA